MPREFSFCPKCGAGLERRAVHGADRLVCPDCTFVFWQNPAVGVAVILLDDEGRVLLGRRSRGAYRGAWCIPCGYVEYDEDVRDAARRECREETGLEVEVGEVFAVHSNFHNPAMHTVGVWFRGEAARGEPRAADDLDRVAFFALDALPAALAFPTDRIVLADLRRASRTAHVRPASLDSSFVRLPRADSSGPTR